jgi:hypothetical protein
MSPQWLSRRLSLNQWNPKVASSRWSTPYHPLLSGPYGPVHHTALDSPLVVSAGPLQKSQAANGSTTRPKGEATSTYREVWTRCGKTRSTPGELAESLAGIVDEELGWAQLRRSLGEGRRRAGSTSLVGIRATVSSRSGNVLVA